jgi:predicted metal-dependent hydrolase
VPAKILEIEDIGPVHFYKKRGSKNIRLSFTSDNNIRVSLPMWVPYKAGITFVQSRRDWVLENRPGGNELLTDGMEVGKTHILRFVADPDSTEVGTQILGRTILIEFPTHKDSSEPEIQQAARKAAHKALRKEASQTLPARVYELAEQHGLTVHDVLVRQLKRRWGSCDSKKVITLNFFLMQAPWELIDYVILHELNHTRHMHHQKDFWDDMARLLPEYKGLRKQLKSYQPILQAM